MRENKRRTLHIVTLATLTATIAGASIGCVDPDNFEGAEQACEGQRFDVDTRDKFCSGQWESKVIHAGDIVKSDASQAHIAVNGRFLTSVQADAGGRAIEVRLFEEISEDAFVTRQEWTRSIELPSGTGGTLTSVAVMGLHNDLIDPLEGTLAIVHDNQSLSLVDLAPQNAHAEFVDDGRSDLPTPTGGIRTADAIDNIISDRARDSLPSDCTNAANNAADGQFEFSDIEPFVSRDAPERRYLAIAARCGTMIYSKPDRVGHHPLVLVELPIESLDIEIDPENERLLVAAGLEGLKIRPTRTLSLVADARYDELWSNVEVDVAESDVNNNGPNNGDGGGEPAPRACGPDDEPGSDVCCDPDAVDSDGAPLDPDCISAGGPDDFNVPPEPVFDQELTIPVQDPSGDDFVNVTRVGFAGDRIIFINSAAVADAEGRSETSLVAGRLSPANTLVERSSLAIKGGLDVDSSDWRLVPLAASTYAVLRTGDDAGDSSLKIYDAPDGHEPTEVLEVPLEDGQQITEVVERDGALWVIYPDRIEQVTVTIGGEVR